MILFNPGRFIILEVFSLDANLICEDFSLLGHKPGLALAILLIGLLLFSAMTLVTGPLPNAPC